MNLFKRKECKKSEFEIEEDDEEKGKYLSHILLTQRMNTTNLHPNVTFADSEFVKSLHVNLSRLIAYAESADIKLQREVSYSPPWYLSDALNLTVAISTVRLPRSLQMKP